MKVASAIEKKAMPWNVEVGIGLYLSKYIVVHKDLGYRAFFPVLYLELFPVIQPLGVLRTVQCSSPYQ